jgi:outer membrane lipoprotein SlyB
MLRLQQNQEESLMKKINTCVSVLGVVTTLALVGCASQPDYIDPGQATQPYSASSNPNFPPPQQAILSGYGVVKGIELVRQDGSNRSNVVGTVAGAIIGGVIGHQIGNGTGQTVATVAGAAGGAYAGNQIERNRVQQYDVYRVTILMDSGTYQTLLLNSNPGLRLEDRVVVDNGVVRRY